MFKKMICLFLILLTCCILFSCSEELFNLKLNSIENLDKYYGEIKERNLEYSLVFIENEIETAKESILDSKKKKDVYEIERNCLNNIDCLILTDEDYNNVMTTYDLEYWSNKTDDEFYNSRTPTIKYYFGKFQDSYVMLLTKPWLIFLPDNPSVEWSIPGTEGSHEIKHLAGRGIDVISNGQFYSLGGLVPRAALTLKDYDLIYERYKLIEDEL